MSRVLAKLLSVAATKHIPWLPLASRLSLTFFLLAANYETFLGGYPNRCTVGVCSRWDRRLHGVVFPPGTTQIDSNLERTSLSFLPCRLRVVRALRLQFIDPLLSLDPEVG